MALIYLSMCFPRIPLRNSVGIWRIKSIDKSRNRDQNIWIPAGRLQWQQNFFWNGPNNCYTKFHFFPPVYYGFYKNLQIKLEIFHRFCIVAVVGKTSNIMWWLLEPLALFKGNSVCNIPDFAECVYTHVVTQHMHTIMTENSILNSL